MIVLIIGLIILFIAFIIAFSGPIKSTIIYAFAGSLFIYLINILRIAFLNTIEFIIVPDNHKQEQIIYFHLE